MKIDALEKGDNTHVSPYRSDKYKPREGSYRHENDMSFKTTISMNDLESSPY